jgi:hypothetical protein
VTASLIWQGCVTTTVSLNIVVRQMVVNPLLSELRCLLSLSLIGEQISQQAIAQLIGDPRYLRFNVLIRKDTTD